MAEIPKLRFYRDRDEEQLVPLLQDGFGGWPQFDIDCTPLDHWNWKFVDNPNRGISIVMGSVDEKIVCCLHDSPRKLKFGEKIFLVSQSVDTFVHPDFRRLGLYTQMFSLSQERRIIEKKSLICSISGNPILVKSSDRKGRPVIPYPLLKMIRINDVDLHFEQINMGDSWLKKHGVKLLKSMSELKKKLARENVELDVNISNITKFDNRINTFWNSIKGDYVFITEKSQEFLNWRYCDKRGGNYHIEIVEDDDRILGYSILRINKINKDYPVGYIVELMSLPGRSDVSNELMKSANQFFDDEGVNVIRAYVLESHPFEKVLENNGYLNSRDDLVVRMLPLEPEVDIDIVLEARAKNIDVQIGYTDWI